MNGAIGTIQPEAALLATRATPRVERTDDLDRARSVAEDFEAFFLGQLLQPMFTNVEAAEPFGGGIAEDMWRSLQVDEYGKAIARSGGIGLADAVMKEIIKLQEGS